MSQFRLSPEEEMEKCRRIHKKNQIATAHANVYNNLKTPYIKYSGAMVESPELIKNNTLILEEQERKIKYKMLNSFHHNYLNY